MRYKGLKFRVFETKDRLDDFKRFSEASLL